MRNRRGNALLESALLVPVIVLLLVGMAQVAKFTYTYYTLRKTVYSIASYLSSQQGVNFCNVGDPGLTQAISFGLTGTTDNSLPVSVTGLDPSMVTITAQRATAVPGGAPSLSDCNCAPDCDLSQGGLPPDYIVVSIGGYALTPRIPGLPLEPILLQPIVKVPYGGT